MQPSANTVKALFIVVAFLAGGNVGLLTGILCGMDGDSVLDAIRYGGAAFAGTVVFVFGLFGFWYGFQNGGK
ncbi:hypothetical protein [Actinomadura sp. K4S16]|uniref:hypothetical protein n=1 Tax=Actinomadura sp. K4S16 TaxID=1316147 RepID=UPI0011EF32FE|nr:hypothetical protein [Actinomadura sp. K4S16]